MNSLESIVISSSLFATRSIFFEYLLSAARSERENILPGDPLQNQVINYSDDLSKEQPSTSHISIVDQYGNALSMTSSIENAFGSRLMTESGFLLNNQLTDFSFKDEVNGKLIANRLQPGKRPRSSMSPTIILQDGKPILVSAYHF